MPKLIFVFFAFFVYVQSEGVNRTPEEINDYKEFLKNTNNGIPSASDNPAWIYSGKFEGDIILTDKQREALIAEFTGSKNALINTRQLWENGIVYYKIATSYFNAEQILAIHAAISDIENQSCLKFIEKEDERGYVMITGMSTGCSSIVGYVGIIQRLNLTPNNIGNGCFAHGTIIHEFLHAVGFYHMHTTYDRDDWVKIFWENIRPGMERNFKLYTSEEVSNLGEEYDYGSVMHYPINAFTINGNPTIEPLKDTGGVILGQTLGMSQRDVIKLNRLYNCPGY